MAPHALATDPVQPNRRAAQLRAALYLAEDADHALGQAIAQLTYALHTGEIHGRDDQQCLEALIVLVDRARTDITKPRVAHHFKALRALNDERGG